MVLEEQLEVVVVDHQGWQPLDEASQHQAHQVLHEVVEVDQREPVWQAQVR